MRFVLLFVLMALCSGMLAAYAITMLFKELTSVLQ